MYFISQKTKETSRDQEGDIPLESLKRQGEKTDEEGPTEIPPTVYSPAKSNTEKAMSDLKKGGGTWKTGLDQEGPSEMPLTTYTTAESNTAKAASDNIAKARRWKRKAAKRSEQTDEEFYPRTRSHEEGAALPSSSPVRQPEEGLLPIQTPTFPAVGQGQQHEVDDETPGADAPVLEGILTQDYQRQHRLDRVATVTATDVHADASEKLKARRRWITIIVVLVVVIGAALGTSLGIVLGRDDDSDGSSTPVPTNVPTASPSFAPSQAPTSFAFSQVAELVESTFGISLADSTSAQYRAAEWIADADILLDLYVVSPQRFMQRYATVVFYYATGGDVSWTSQANFLEPDTHECEWFEPAPAGLFTITGNRGVAECTGGKEVHTVELVGNNLTGSVPPEIAAFTGMDLLVLNENRIGGALPTELFSLSNLQALWVPFNDFSGTIPTEIGNLESIGLLWLQRSPRLTGNIPSEMGLLRNLLNINLNELSLDSTIPTTLLQLSQLAALSLFHNELTGQLPTSFPSAWPNLQLLDVNSNRLTGVLPSDIGSLSSLKSITGQNNTFSGHLPNSFVNLELLETVDFQDNMFTGSLPNDWTRMTSLTHISFLNNKLTGTLPRSLGSLTNIQVLSLGGNLFNGSIPVEFANLSANMEFLLLQNNLLTGTIPDFFAEFRSLQLATFHRNLFSGDMSFFCDDMDEIIIPSLHALTADCLGEVECPCCILCCDEEGECQNL